MKKLILILFACGLVASVSAQEFDRNDLEKHLAYLASDKLKGREPGTHGEWLAYRYIRHHFMSYGLKGMFGRKNYKQDFSYRVRKNPHDSVGKGSRKHGMNVIGFLDNGAPTTIVIGGHYDHLGKHAHPSSLDKNKEKNVIHNGADDNASGAAGVLMLAKYFAGNGLRETSNFLFICFSGEEDGLVGSKYFTNHSPIDLAKITCMINMDMIGRLNDSTNKVLVYGVGTSPVIFHHAFTTINTSLKLAFDSSGIGPSDQTSFYIKNIPVLHFFTGQHADYHKSTDDFQKINFSGELMVLDLIAKIATKLSYEPTIPFLVTKQKDQTKISFKVTLGVMPDYTFEGIGMRIDAVTEGKPADKAGLKAGDVLVKMSDTRIEDVYGYMKVLSTFKKGEKTGLEVMRNGASMKFDVEF